MTPSAYYNEIDPFSAAWLRELIKAGAIVPGDVDERDIRDVQPADLRGYTQCHFFAGIGGWSHALRLAGFPDGRGVWTGSCPCQGFSTAGKRAGFSDPRHLWPEWFRLVRECRPTVVFGEQVEAAIGHGWWDLVQRDLEGEGYACGMAVLGAHSVGAPHRRQRCYFVAESACELSDGSGDAGPGWGIESANGGCDGILAHAPDLRRIERWPAASTPLQGERSERSGEHARPKHAGELSRGLEGLCGDGFWANAEWLPCRDNKLRPVEPGTFPLAHGVSARVGRLRGYGNAIVPQAAQAFIEAYMETAQ